MAKKSKEPESSVSLRFWIYGLLLIVIGWGGWWIWQNTETKEIIYQYIENGTLVTLESKYTPQQIMEAHRAELIGKEKRTYQESSLHYSPYLLLEVKYYTEDKKSREGILLWGMENGEIVLNTETWETTHGFKDCLDCEANRNDFKVLQALARKSGLLSIEELQKDLHVEREMLEGWIESAQKKHLIVQKGNLIHLHFENPKILVSPQTEIKQYLVSKPFVSIQKGAKTYSRAQIVKLAKTAFGNEFTIRHEQEIFLPVYGISVLNPDGSTHVSEWNAINGQRIKGHSSRGV